MAPLVLPLFPVGAGYTVEIDGVTYRIPLIDADGHLQIDVLSSALPAGAATSGRQDSIIASLLLLEDLREALSSEATDSLLVEVIANAYPPAPTTPASGVVTVASAGNRVQLPDVECKSLSVKAHPGNTGLIYVGGATVAAANGYRLNPGDAVDMVIDNTNKLYVDAATGGDGISYLAVA